MTATNPTVALGELLGCPPDCAARTRHIYDAVLQIVLGDEQFTTEQRESLPRLVQGETTAWWTAFGWYLAKLPTRTRIHLMCRDVLLYPHKPTK